MGLRGAQDAEDRLKLVERLAARPPDVGERDQRSRRVLRQDALGERRLQGDRGEAGCDDVVELSCKL
jgi:hypothetical protein